MARLYAVSVLFLVSTGAGCMWNVPNEHLTPGQCYRRLMPGRCYINTSKLNKLIVVSPHNYEFLYPESRADTITIPPCSYVTISCPGGQLSAFAQIGQTVNAKCYSGTEFCINEERIDFNTIECSVNPKHTARYTGKTSSNGAAEIEIGFDLGDYSFVRQIQLYFNQSTKTTLYSVYSLPKYIGHRRTNATSPSFTEDDFYNLGIGVNELYTRNHQKTTINKLLGLPNDSTKYINDFGDFYLARAHLAAKADFVYAPQQQATFHFCNAAPQWQTFNAGNWRTAEMNVRNYARSRELDLIIYTGTYGVATLPNERGQEVPLHLYVDPNGNSALPVPELFWKVVYDPLNERGVVLLGLNNPYQQNVNKSLICKNVSSSINWLTWKAANQKSGYSYACDVNDFRESVSCLPDFKTTGLLV